MSFLLVMSFFLQIHSPVVDPGDAEQPMCETEPFEKPGWKLLYEHDQNGGRIQGELEHLLRAIDEGLAIKVAVTQEHFRQMIACDAVRVSTGGDVVVCQKANLIGLNGFIGVRFGLNAEIKRKLMVVDSQGGVHTQRWLVDGDTAPLSDTQRQRILWFARVE